MTEAPAARIFELVARQASLAPDAVAIIDSDGKAYSYAAFDAAIRQVALLLKEQGVAPNDRVLLVAENCFATAVFIFAASVAGAYAVPVNARMSEAEIARVIAHATPRVTAYMTGVSPDAAAHAKAASATEHEAEFGRFALAVTGASDPEGVAQGEAQTAIILYTTGTTGAPKGVMLTHENLLFAAKASARQREMTAADRIYGVLPLTHVFGLASMLMASAYAGATVQLETRFQPARLYDALTGGVTVFPGVPQMHALLMQYTREQGLERLEDSALRYVSSGAAPLDPAWKRKAEAFYGVALQNGYGMTESTAGISGTRNPIGTPDTSVGRALPDIEVALDATVGGGDASIGEILSHGPHIMKGYFRNAEETARTVDAEGWLRTGDLGQFDDDGNLHVVGRCKELIIRGGFNVYPPEVEAALNDHPDVIQSAVIGRALDGNEEILAFVQCAAPETFDVAELAAFAGEKLSGYKQPSRIFPVSELPAAATGKVLKHKLLATFAALLDES